MYTEEFLSKEKKIALENELTFLKTEKRSEILERLAFAKSLGDLSENAEYHSSKEEQGKNEARINQIETILKSAILVEANTDGTIGLGSVVVLIKGNSKEEIIYQIVGNEEADLPGGKISFESPLGGALMDKCAGEEITLVTPRGETVYIIKKVK